MGQSWNVSSPETNPDVKQLALSCRKVHMGLGRGDFWDKKGKHLCGQGGLPV